MKRRLCAHQLLGYLLLGYKCVLLGNVRTIGVQMMLLVALVLVLLVLLVILFFDEARAVCCLGTHL